MRTFLFCTLLILSACGTALNPANWFGRGQSEPVATVPQEEVNPLIPDRDRASFNLFGFNDEEEYMGSPIEVVSDLVIERVPGGAMIRASGISSFQGAFDVRLTPENEDEVPVEGVLSYRLEVVRPDAVRLGGPERDRKSVV